MRKKKIKIKVRKETKVYLSGCSQEALDSFGSLNALKVDGYLGLWYCAGLKKLPDGLMVGGVLNLGYCIGLTRLPDGLIVAGGLNLGHCIGLTSLPDDLNVGEVIWYNLKTGFCGHEHEPGVIPDHLKNKLHKH
jgi:hypothetical protein